MTDTTPLGLIVVRLKVPVKNMPVGTELGYKDVPDAIAALGSAAFFDVVRDQQGNPIPPLTPEEIEEAQRAAQRRAKSRRLILGADFDPLWNRVEGIPDAGELEQMRQDVDAVAEVPGRVDAVETALAPLQVNTAILTAQRFDPTHPDYGAVRGTGLTSAQRRANVAAINAAAADAAAADGVLEARGKFEVEGEIVIQCRMVEMSGAQIEQYDPDAVTITYGTTTPGQRFDNPWASFPQLNNATKIGFNGWTGESVGIRVANIFGGHLFFQQIRHFTTGLDVVAYSHGMVDANFYLSRLINNKIGLHIRGGDTGGWANENNFFGGKWQSTGAEGDEIPGMVHIKMTRFPGGNAVDKNVFTKPNLEGNGPEFHIDMDGTSNTLVISPRLETSGSIKAKWRVNSTSNVMILSGYSMQSVVWSGDSIDQVDGLFAPYKAFSGRFSGGVLRVKNTEPDGNDPPVIISPPDGDSHLDFLGDNYLWRLGTRTLRGKGEADTEPRVQIRFSDSLRAIWLGTGSAAPDIHLGRMSSTPEGAVSGNPGSVMFSALGRLYLKSSGTGNTGWLPLATIRSGPTASRPAPSSVLAGTEYFDTDMNKPLWSNGSAWVDATGTAV